MDSVAEKLYPQFGHDMTGAGIRDDGLGTREIKWIFEKGRSRKRQPGPSMGCGWTLAGQTGRVKEGVLSVLTQGGRVWKGVIMEMGFCAAE